MTLAQRLKSRREQLKLTQSYVAKKIGVATQTIFKYENEIVTNIPLDRLELLAKALDVSPAYLMGWEDLESESIETNNLIADIIIKLRTDDSFREVVEKLSMLSPDKLTVVKMLLNTFEQ